ncbi:helix-turn-helix domain-containing protein [Pseudomonas sp. Marseille-Q5115]|uniref:helix-turn-helix domain-containing protein n=1 Tax=Pseudomonas sp. Marseille-Q5115 TaxID=2866593 RepID=UPI001CE432E9|nr:helix-turn-helix domain-containing protein [Pseudomonas sp. Marseille-Q5115]
MSKDNPEVRKLVQPADRGTWVQTERAGHEALAQLISQAPRAAQLLHVLVANMDRTGALIASQATLAKLTNVSTATTKRALQVLIQQRWIQTIRLGSERGGALAYVVNSRIAWADKRENLQYARFSAQVLISSEDQVDLGTGELKSIPSVGLGEQQLPSGESLSPPAQDSFEDMLPDLPALREREHDLT